LLLLVLCGTAAAPAAGQSNIGTLRFEAYGGAFFDDLRNERGSGNPGWIGGVRLGLETGYGLLGPERNVRLVLDAARAETDEAGVVTVQDSIDIGFRNEYWLLTGGVEWDVVGGWTGLTLEARGGGAWHQAVVVAADSGFVPGGTPGTTSAAEYDVEPALVVGVSAFHHLSWLLQLRARVEDVIVDPFGEARHSQTLELGLRLVFE